MFLRRRQLPRPWAMVALPLGLGLSSFVFIAWLGLRWPVVIGALAPPVIAGGLWTQRQRKLTAATIASGNLLDPWILQQRLGALMPVPPKEPSLLRRWQDICSDLEEIRQLAASCSELDATSTVPLLVMLEGWLDQIQKVAADLQPGQRAKTGGNVSTPHGQTDLAKQLQLCRSHLAEVHRNAEAFSLQHPQLPVLLPPLPSSFTP